MGYFFRLERLLQIWSNGIVEYWKVVLKRIEGTINTTVTINLVLNSFGMQYSNIPAFHRSNWGEVPNLRRSN
jgi:hypothetical protein